MRWLVIAAVAAFCSSAVTAMPSGVAEVPAADVAAPSVVADPAVVVTPIPAPARVTELLKEVNSTSATRPAKKLKVAKKPVPSKLMLSRTERHQVALMTSAKPKAGVPVLVDFSDDEDAAPGAEDLDLHRSFSRPKVATIADQDDEDDAPGLSDTVKVRLLLARMKAVEAHQATWGDQARDDEGISDAVKLRLYMARMKAVQAHQKKFS